MTTRQDVLTALRRLTPTLRDVAKTWGVSYGSVRAYSQGIQTASPSRIKALVALLRRQAKMLNRLADRLGRTL